MSYCTSIHCLRFLFLFLLDVWYRGRIVSLQCCILTFAFDNCGNDGLIGDIAKICVLMVLRVYCVVSVIKSRTGNSVFFFSFFYPLFLFVC